MVCEDGRPQLVEPYLSAVRSPTLFVVGGADEVLVEANRLGAEREVAVLFEEPGIYAEVARLARDWLASYLKRKGSGERIGESRK